MKVFTKSWCKHWIYNFYTCDLITLKALMLISSYGAPLAQIIFYLAPHSFLFRPDSTVNYDYIVTNSINYLLIS